MGIVRRFRWWIFLPLVFVLLVPAWEWLGALLGYDLFPAPDPEPPRFASSWLAIPYYVVWYLIMFLILMPGLCFAPALGWLPHSIGYRILPALVALFYCCVFATLRWGISFLLRRFRSARAASPRV
jgi:hypothetical protein